MTRFAELIEGYRRFRNGGWQEQRDRWEQLAEGQSPKVMVIACSDSRSEPSQIFDTNPGEIFVVRNVGALVPPFETNPGRHGVSAALEFAVQFLHVEEIVVMGHGMCGGCHGAAELAMDRAQPGRGGLNAPRVGVLRDASAEIRARYPDYDNREAGRAMELAAVGVSLANLRTFPCIQEKEKRGSLKLRGAFFAINEGLLYVMDETTGDFTPA